MLPREKINALVNRFEAIADRGKPVPAMPKMTPEQAAAREREDLEASMRWTQEILRT